MGIITLNLDHDLEQYGYSLICSPYMDEELQNRIQVAVDHTIQQILAESIVRMEGEL